MFIWDSALCLYFLILFLFCCSQDVSGLERLGSWCVAASTWQCAGEVGAQEGETRYWTVSSMDPRGSHENCWYNAENSLFFSFSDHQFLHSVGKMETCIFSAPFERQEVKLTFQNKVKNVFFLSVWCFNLCCQRFFCFFVLVKKIFDTFVYTFLLKTSISFEQFVVWFLFHYVNQWKWTIKWQLESILCMKLDLNKARRDHDQKLHRKLNFDVKIQHVCHVLWI